MAPRAREKASKVESDKGKLAVGDEHDDDEEAADDPQPSHLQSRKKRLRSFLSPFDKGELFDLLVQIGTKIPAAADEIRDAANAHPQNRKLCVRSLNPKTTTETLCAAFSSFGEIEDGYVKDDRNEGESRYHGYITFKNIESAEEALENPPEKIDGYAIDCSYAFDRLIRSSTKIRVSGLPLDATAATLRSHFSKYGEIEKSEVIYVRGTNKSKGYGFVTFRTIEGARQANRDPNKFMGRKYIYVRYSDSNSKKRKRPRIMRSESTAPLPPSPPRPPRPPPPPLPPTYAAYPYHGPYAIVGPHYFGANEAYPYSGPYADAGPHYFGGNEAYGMPPWGRSGYPYH